VNAVSSKGFLQAFGYTVLITVTSVAADTHMLLHVRLVHHPHKRQVQQVPVFSVCVLHGGALPDADVHPVLHRGQAELNTPFNICIIYLGFGAGLSVFMFCGFVKNIPVEVEEAAMIDGCNPLQTFFKVVLPIMKPTYISVGILETMWIWNDYLLPYLVLDRTKYMTIPILIQYFRGSYGKVEMGPMMACIMLTILPVIIVYLVCQKYIIKGVVAGAVKG
jgi:raffinose/stachyose/melibiose transport system permease protein